MKEVARHKESHAKNIHMQWWRMMRRYARYEEWSKNKTGGGWNDEQNGDVREQSICQYTKLITYMNWHKIQYNDVCSVSKKSENRKVKNIQRKCKQKSKKKQK